MSDVTVVDHPLATQDHAVQFGKAQGRGGMGAGAEGEAGIEKQISDIATAAARAREAGYDGVEVMGSEGYFLNQFLSLRTNRREDRWGGAYENRMRLPVEVVRRVRAAVGDDFIVIYRISMIDLVPGGSSWPEVAP